MVLPGGGNGLHRPKHALHPLSIGEKRVRHDQQRSTVRKMFRRLGDEPVGHGVVDRLPAMERRIADDQVVAARSPTALNTSLANTLIVGRGDPP